MKKFNNLPELFFYQASKLSNKPHLKKINTVTNQIETHLWKDTLDEVSKVYQFLDQQKLNNFDRVMLVSENRPEWMISDLAIMSSKLITVPNYITYTSKDFQHIIADSNPNGLIVSNLALLKKIIQASKLVNFNFNFILVMDKFNENLDIQNIYFWQNLVSSHNIDFYKYKSLKRTDPSCIIYTSGTQGQPKGVTLSHGGILSNCEAADIVLHSIKSKELCFLTWLPLSHSYEHTVQFAQITLGAITFYNESIEKLLPTLKIAKPHILTAVPRFYNNLYSKMQLNLSKQSYLKKLLFNKTVEIGIKVNKQKQISYLEKFLNLLLSLLVRRKIKNQFGGNLIAFVSGGGPLDSQIGNTLNALGIKTLQGYGLTETSPVVSCNPLTNIKVETVGPVLPNVEVKLADDGEILVRGEVLMIGYWNNNEATSEIIKDGWLYTGDIGKFDSDNYLIITDRKKDIIVSSGGDNISPSKLENLLTLDSKIEQACVFGDNKSYISALLVINSQENPNKNEIQNYINNLNLSLSQPEKIKRFKIIEMPFSMENELLTPTMKVRRYKVYEQYKELIDSM
ncbi:long-chain fatty acid--CoA ligase [Alphaproteobacteria bacterium]|nr:long-chain fatty acid--CoA ligase [Alphaproteobacteria bacterium]